MKPTEDTLLEVECSLLSLSGIVDLHDHPGANLPDTWVVTCNHKLPRPVRNNAIIAQLRSTHADVDPPLSQAQVVIFESVVLCVSMQAFWRLQHRHWERISRSLEREHSVSCLGSRNPLTPNPTQTFRERISVLGGFRVVGKRREGIMPSHIGQTNGWTGCCALFNRSLYGVRG
jgi:hypothetical protein